LNNLIKHSNQTKLMSLEEIITEFFFYLEKTNSLQIFNPYFNNIRCRFEVTDGFFKVGGEGVGDAKLVSCFGQ